MAETKCSLGPEIGEGSYARIYDDRKGGVIKVWKANLGPLNSTAEIDILFRLHSPYLLPGLQIWNVGECGPNQGFAVEMPRLTGEIKTLVQSTSVNFGLLKSVLLDLALAVECLHHNNYLHLDISQGNALYSGVLPRIHGVLIDYGLAMAFQRDAKDQPIPVKTLQPRIPLSYRDLENFDRGDEYFTYTYSDKSDIWSLGILYLQMLNRGVLMDQKDYTEAEALKFIEEVLASPEVEIKLQNRLRHLESATLDAVMPLILGMLDVKSSTRFNIDQVVTHPFFAKELKAATRDCTTITIPPGPEIKLPDLDIYIAHLFQTLRKHYSRDPAELLFVALDVAFRVLAMADSKESRTELETKVEAARLVASALSESTAMAIWPEIEDYYDKAQSPMLKSLGGIIRRPYLYDAAESLDHLVQILKQLPSVYKDYLYIDVPALMTGYHREIKSRLGPKSTTIDELLRHLDSEPTLDLPPVPLLDIKPGKSVLQTAYEFLVVTLVQDFQNNHTQVFFEAIDIFVSYRLLITNQDLKQAKEQAIAAILVSHLKTYMREDLVPAAYDRKNMPVVWELKNRMPVSTNPLYAAARSMDDLRILYHNVLLDSGQILERYPKLRAEVSTVLSEVQSQFQIRDQPKLDTIGVMFSLAIPPRK